jgi:hypothetical protein
MQNRLISENELSRAIKNFFIGLIEQGKNVVEITECNAEIHKLIVAMPGHEAIEWNDVEKVGLPLVSDEYIVMICGAASPTCLLFDREEGVFFEERIDLDEDVTYKVTHWAELPGGPDE